MMDTSAASTPPVMTIVEDSLTVTSAAFELTEVFSDTD
jgi:hypothetical protein